MIQWLLQGVFYVKGLIFETQDLEKRMAQTASLEAKQAVQELIDARRQMTQHLLGNCEMDDESDVKHLLEKLAYDIEEKERDIAVGMPEGVLRRRLAIADVQSVREHLPQRTSLLEVLQYRRRSFDAVTENGCEAWNECRYVAFGVVAACGDSPFMFDVGPAEEIDAQVSQFRNLAFARSATKRAQRTEIGVALRQKLVDPFLDKVSGGVDHIFLALDGELARLPVVALQSKTQGKDLIDEPFTFSHVFAGRDIVRVFGKMSQVFRVTDPVVIADPDFGYTLSQTRVSQGEMHAELVRDMKFDQLPASLEEGRAVSQLLGAELITGRNATARAFLSVSSPRYLHVATHGFDLSSGTGKPQNTPSRLEYALSRIENPMLQSGLAFAGARAFQDGAKHIDSIVTAQDVRGMNLQGTDLVSLMTCDSGLGELSLSQGVQGVGRACLIAGALSILTSLWHISDKSTYVFVQEFYNQLVTNGRHKAVAVQMAQRHLRDQGAPMWHWAGFILQGSHV